MIDAGWELTIREKFIGVPYKHMGRTLSGLDCWGLVLAVYAEIGYKLFDLESEQYDFNWSKTGRNYFIENYHQDWLHVEVPYFPDLALFKNTRGVSNHVGIVLKNHEFIHCPRVGVVVQRLDEPVWRNRLVGFYRFRKLDVVHR